jgi:tetratricopeptide (TPR) repeat protein
MGKELLISGCASHGKRRYGLQIVLGSVLVLALAAAGAAFWFYRTSPLDYQLRRSEAALQENDWDKAERLAERLENSGYADQAYLLRGKILYTRAKPYLLADQPHQVASLLKRALDEFNKIRDQDEIRLEAAILSGECLLYLQQPSEAARAFSFVVRERPDCIDARRGLAAIYFDQGALTQALRQCDDWARLDPRDGRPLRFMGHIHKELDQPSEAIAAFKEALRRDLGERFREEVKENLAEVLVRHSDYAEALETLASCNPEASAKPRLLALQGECLWVLQNPSEARALVDRALQANPNFADLLRLRAEIYLQDSEPKAAVALLERAVGVDRHDQAIRQLLAQAYERLGKRAEALEQRRLAQKSQDLLRDLIKQSREAVSKSWKPELGSQLAELCEQLDRPDLAAMWRQVAKAKPTDHEAATSRAFAETDRFTSSRSRSPRPLTGPGESARK